MAEESLVEHRSSSNCLWWEVGHSCLRRWLLMVELVGEGVLLVVDDGLVPPVLPGINVSTEVSTFAISSLSPANSSTVTWEASDDVGELDGEAVSLLSRTFMDVGMFLIEDGRCVVVDWTRECHIDLESMCQIPSGIVDEPQFMSHRMR